MKPFQSLRPFSAMALGLLIFPSATASAQSIHAEFYAPYPNDIAGTAAARVGDVNDDGFAEYLLAAPGLNGAVGRAYLVDGRYHYILRTHEGPSTGSMLGGAVAGGVDWNQDGVPDYAIGYPRASVGAMAHAGMVRIYSGKDGSLLQSFFGTQAHMRLGAGLCFLGDVDGDGRTDLAAGATDFVSSDNTYRGVIRLYSGMTGMVIRDMPGAHVSNSDFGKVLAPAGDWNGDGVADLIAGLPGYSDDDTGPGAVWILSGATGNQLAYFVPPVGGSNFGSAVAAMPDRDGDGKPELLIGAPKELGVGAVRLVSSATKQTLGLWYGQAPGSDFGRAIAVVGDVDQDGAPDFAVTSPAGGPEALRIFSGATFQTLWQPLFKNQSLPVLGQVVVPLGDHDGDGWLDLLVTDVNSYVGGSLAGGAVVVRAALHQPNLGFQGPGNAKLTVHGKPLSLGGHADVGLSTAGAHRPGILVASYGSNPTPIYGGTLVPLATGILIPFVTDADGRMQLKGIPGGLGAFSMYTQAVVVNPSQPQGFGFSNAVRLDFLP